MANTRALLADEEKGFGIDLPKDEAASPQVHSGNAIADDDLYIDREPNGYDHNPVMNFEAITAHQVL